MKKFILFVSAIMSMVLSSCNTNIIDETENQSDETQLKDIRGRVVTSDAISFDGCKVTTISGEAEVLNNQFSVESSINRSVQTFFVNDDSNVYLIYRGEVEPSSNITINEESTAIALVTLHPLFSPTENIDYKQLESVIRSSEKYPAFEKEVKKTISEKRNLYDQSNDALLIAISNLLEDLCGENDPSDENYTGELDDIQGSTAFSRAVYDNPKIYPLYADISGNKLTLRTTGLTPSYYGTVTYGGTTPANFAVTARSDFGGMDLFFNRTVLGPECIYTFTKEGEYVFSLSRTNAEATLDFYMRVTGSILSTLGLSMAKGDTMIVEISKTIANAITAAGSSICDTEISPMEWLGIAYGATTDYLSRNTSYLAQRGLWAQARQIGSILGGAFNWYNKIKGAANFAMRLAYAFGAPEELNFCLCYYDHQIDTCTESSLTKVKGDEQKGYAKQKLLLPLTVYVTTLGDDELYTSPRSYHKIKYEVVSGGGRVDSEIVSADENNTASTYWTLGEGGDQMVKAVVMDMITDKEISEPVYFTASIVEAEVTIRLDWSQHSGHTDIDLHVIDPFGERIWYQNMSSASGGWLDRDDTHGPGPEHIHWDNAPAGTYKIYVHYYPNDDEDKSVVSYKVSVNADGVVYKPKTGSISYDQMVPIGQFTIGNNSSRTTLESTNSNVEAIKAEVSLHEKK